MLQRPLEPERNLVKGTQCFFGKFLPDARDEMLLALRSRLRTEKLPIMPPKLMQHIKQSFCEGITAKSATELLKENVMC